MFYYKLHETKFGTLLAACDKDISGKTLKHNELEIFVNPRFYGENEADEEHMSFLFKDISDANLVGEKIINLAIKHKLISRSSVKKISKVPMAQFSNF